MIVETSTVSSGSTTADDSAMGRAIDAYLVALESGRPLAPALLEAIRPEVADRLRDCLAVLNVGRGPCEAFGTEAARLGDFALVRPIARGGMGVVFEACQVSLRRRVAVKILPLAATLDPIRLGRFQVEARAAATLHHTHIVPVFSVGRERGVHYYAMQYIEGRSLADEIRELRGGDDRNDEPPPPPSDSSRHRRVAELGEQAADALDHAHRSGVIHRDVKPSNLMVDSGGSLWITDFGLARLEADSSLTLAGSLLGTLNYISPEQADGDPARIDGRTDVYSLGATLYELLTLRPIREGRDRAALLAQIAAGEVKPPRAIDRRVPRELETIVLKALARDPAERYQTAGAMAEDLRRYLDDRPILGRRPSPLSLAARWVRRRKAGVVAAVLTGLLAAASLTALALAARNRELARAERRAVYVRDVARAGRQIRLGDVDEAARLLALHVPAPGVEDQSGFAWRHLRRVCRVRPDRLAGHAGDVYHVEYSPDGRTFATAGRDGAIRLWNAGDGAAVRVLLGHEGDVDFVAFAPDGRSIASCGDDGSVRLWDLDDATGSSRIVGRSDVETVAVVFSPDGRSLISGDDAGVVTSWSLDGGGGRVLRRLGDRIGSLAIATDGRSLVAAVSQSKPRSRGRGPSGFRILDLDDPDGDATSTDVVSGQAVAVSPDGRLAAVADQPGAIRFATLGSPAATFRPGRLEAGFEIDGLCFSPDGRVIAGCGSGGMIALWDVRSGALLWTFVSPASRCWSVAFSPDGRALAATCDDGRIDLWDVTADQPRRRWPIPARIGRDSTPTLSETGAACARFDADRGAVALASWDVRGRMTAGVPPIPVGRLVAAAVADDRETVAVLDRDAPDVVTIHGRGAPIRELAFPERSPDQASNRLAPVLVFGPRGARLAAWMPDDRLVVWNLATGRGVESPAGAVSTQRPVFSPDGSLLALMDGDVPRIWELSTGRVVEYRRGRQGFPAAVAFSADGGTLAVASDGEAIALWRLDAPESDPAILNDVGDFHALAFSPDGRVLACACGDGQTTLLDLDSRRVILKLETPRAASALLRFAPDGGALLQLSWSSGAEAVLSVWDGRP